LGGLIFCGNNSSMTNRFGFPVLGYGMGLRTQHYDTIFSTWPKAVDWFEIISENFMDTDGKPIRNLEKVLAHYPVVMHGVGLSIGSTDPLDMEYLKKLKALAGKVNPPWISDHLCWTGVHGKNSHDLLPVPYTEASLKHTVERIKKVQDYLGRRILMENPSTYMEFKQSTISEWEFIARMAEEADCGLLLDANNIYVSCYNHRTDTKAYIDAIPMDRVVQIHLAGHDNKGTHIIDTHGGEVIEAVWNIYRYIIAKTGDVATMVEWDDNIPAFEVVLAEVEKARAFARSKQSPNQLPDFSQPMPEDGVAARKATFNAMMDGFQDVILTADMQKAKPAEWVRPKKDFPAESQLGVYVDGYRFRLFDVVDEDYPALRQYLGDETMNALLDAYIESHPPTHFNLARYTDDFPKYVGAWGSFAEGQNKQVAQEIAALETAVTQVADLKETVAFSPRMLGAITPDAFLELRIPPRTALTLMAFEHDVNTYVRAVAKGMKLSKIAQKKNYLAIFRDEDQVWRLPLEKEEYLFLAYLKEGKSVGEAMESLIETTRMDENKLAEKFQEWFARWTQNHLLAAPHAA
jgi:uncharacterized protein (UPF0276 family)